MCDHMQESSTAVQPPQKTIGGNMVEMAGFVASMCIYEE